MAIGLRCSDDAFCVFFLLLTADSGVCTIGFGPVVNRLVVDDSLVTSVEAENPFVETSVIVTNGLSDLIPDAAFAGFLHDWAEIAAS